MEEPLLHAGLDQASLPKARSSIESPNSRKNQNIKALIIRLIVLDTMTAMPDLGHRRKTKCLYREYRADCLAAVWRKSGVDLIRRGISQAASAQRSLLDQIDVIESLKRLDDKTLPDAQ